MHVQKTQSVNCGAGDQTVTGNSVTVQPQIARFQLKSSQAAEHGSISVLQAQLLVEFKAQDSGVGEITPARDICQILPPMQL
jgi:hypothetical protein